IADSLLETGALSATAFVQAVPAAQRPRFERARGYPIIERTPLGDFREAGQRGAYFPLVFAATAAELGVGVPEGIDVGSDGRRAAHLLRARDSGEAAATPVIRLAIGDTGITVFHPVYEDGAATATVAQRRAALLGFAAGGFSVADLTAAAQSTLASGVDVQLVERGRTVSGPSLPREESAAVPVRIADRSWLLVVRDPSRPGVSLPVLIAFVGISLAAVLGALVLVWSRSERMQELQRQASQDPLTGLKNRRRFAEDLGAELARSRRDSSSGAVLMLDLDNFKQVNDTLGHPIGDRVIADIATVLHGRMRETDVVARLGGDEFGIVLPRCEEAEARAVAAEIATAIREHAPSEEGVPAITASIGIALFGADPESSLESLLIDADAAMYEAKRGGRDSVRLAAGRAPA
ncbi:MAG: diguanylate cyclase, partial [Solirubrobacterales bacterium]